MAEATLRLLFAFRAHIKLCGFVIKLIFSFYTVAVRPLVATRYFGISSLSA
jgi:hypothetical protein